MAIKILKPKPVDTPVVTESGSPLSACHPTRRAERTTKPPTIELMNIKQAASFWVNGISYGYVPGTGLRCFGRADNHQPVPGT